MLHLRQWFFTFAFTDDDKTRAAAILNFMLIAQMTLISAALLLSVFFNATMLSRLWLLVLILLMMLALLVLTRRGAVRLSSALLIGGMWGILVFGTLTSKLGIDSDYFRSLFIVILLAGLLFGGRAALTMAALSLLAGMLIILLGAPVLPDAAQMPQLEIWIVHALNFTLIAILLGISSQQYKYMVQRARTSESQLAQHNQALEREMAERSHMEEAYRSLVEHSLQGLVIVQNWRIVFTNPTMVSILGYSEGELLALDNIAVLIHDEDRERVGDYIGRRLRGEDAPSEYEFRAVRKDGEARWLRVYSVKVTYQGEAATQATAIDITEHKQAEKALLKQEKYQKLILNSLPMMLYAAGGVNEYQGLWITDSFQRITGYLPEQYTSEKGFWASRLHPEYQRKSLQEFVNVAGEKYYFREYQWRVADGSYRWFHDHAILIEEGDGKPKELMGAWMDITERKQAEQRAQELALERNRVHFLTEFIGNISHDLKTPLTIINTNLYLLERLSDPAQQQDKLESIKVQTKRLGNLLQDIIAISRLDHIPALDFEAVNLCQLLQETVEKFRPAFEQRLQKVTLDLPTLPLMAQANSDELQRVLVNLIENAVSYTPEQGEIALRVLQAEQQAVFEIRDTGIGMTPEEMQQIFSRFYRSPQARKMSVTGTGLGLAMVRKIIDMHGGDIQVESVPGEGSTFRVYLTLVAQRAGVGG
jgi:PAS domain S-box-containing protein